MTDVLHVIARLSRDQGGLLSTLRSMCAALDGVGLRSTVASVGEGENVEHAELIRFAPGRPRRLAASPKLKAWLQGNAARFDAVIAHGLWLSPTRYAYGAARAAKRPFFLRPAGMLDPDALAHHPLRKTLRWWLGERGMVRQSHLLFSTEEDRRRAVEHLKLEASRCHVVPNPVDDSFFALTPAAQVPPLILCLNRLHPRKGVKEWIEALALLAKRGVPFEAIHAGAEEEATYAAQCRALGRGLPLRFEGAVAPDRVRELLVRASVLVHPTTGYENFGMVIAEAMAAGVPVAASRRALVVPQLERERLIETCEPTPEGLAQAMVRAIAQQGRASRARQYALAHFSASVVGAALVRLLNAPAPR